MLRSYLCRASLLLSAVGSAALVTSCGDAVVYRGVEKEAPAAEATEYSLKVYVTDEKGVRLVEIPPVERWTKEKVGRSSTARQRPLGQSEGLSLKTPGARTEGHGLGLLGIVDLGDAGTKDTAEEDAEHGYYPGWTLLHWARDSCINAGGYLDFPLFLLDAPWTSAESWYFFTPKPLSPLSYPQDCDQQLANQEILLCTADRLAEAANSVGKVVWTLPGDVSGSSTMTITIPPQATEDKFIARDMAMNVLAHLAKWNSIAPVQTWPEPGATCDDAYAAFAAGLANVPGAEWTGTFPDGAADPLRDIGTYFPPDDAPATETDLLAGSVEEQQRVGIARVRRKAALLSAAGRLMKSLIETAVEADLAGAEQQRANAADPAAGVKAFWGRDALEPYNTMRHVLSVLYGRMEMGVFDSSNPVYWDAAGPTPYDPGNGMACNGTLSADLVDTLPQQAAREAIVAPSTAAQARALALLQSAGIVMHPDEYDESLSSRSGVDVVENQLVLNTAASTGQDVADVGLLEAAAREVWGSLSMADRRYALGQIYGAVQLMSLDDSAMTPAERAEAAGLRVRDVTDPDETLEAFLYADGGFVLAGGVPLENLSTELTATLGSAQAQVACNAMDVTSWNRSMDERIATQGAFEVGAVLRRALVHMKGLTESSNDADLSRQLDSAASELAAWVGPGELTFWHYDSTSASDLLDVDFTGMQPSDLGAADWTEVGERLVLVDGPHYEAECVAGLRKSTDCPSPLAGTLFEPDWAGVCGTGYADGYAKGYSCFAARFLQSIPEHTLYVVMEATENKSGSVVAAILPRHNAARVTAVSSLRNELASEALGIKEPAYRGTSCSGVTEFLAQQNYCVQDMPRHMFVPVANELTSGGGTAEDSWRHYLNVAKEAAQEADALGRDLIEFGVQRDIRAEAAIERVGDLCGSYPNVASIEYTDNVPSSKDDARINSCVGEDKYDVVFLTEDPYAEGQEQQLLDDYCTDVTQERQPPFCGKAAGELRHAGLNLSKAIAPEDLGDPCKAVFDAQPVANAGGASKLDLAAFGKMAGQDYASQLKLREALADLKMIQTDQSWILKKNDTILMGDLDGVPTNYADVWPACEEASDPLNPCTERALWLGQLFAPEEVSSGDPLMEADVARQVEETLYAMGALTGEVISGTLEKPMPLLDKDWPGGPAPLGVVYVADVALDATGTYRAVSDDGTDVAQIGELWQPDPADFDRLKVLAPDWLDAIYDPAVTTGLYHFSPKDGNGYLEFLPELRNVLDKPENVPIDTGNMARYSDYGGREFLGSFLQEKVRLIVEDGADASKLFGGLAYPAGGPRCGPNGNIFSASNLPPSGGQCSPGWCPLDQVALIGGAGCSESEAVTINNEQITHVKIACMNPDFFAPHECDVGQRMESVWYGRRDMDDQVGRLRPITKALGLSCHLTHRTVELPEGQVPLEMDSLEDLLRLEIWVGRAAQQAEKAAGRLPIYFVPDRVVLDYVEGDVGSGTVGQGDHGDLVIQYGNALREIHDAWVSLGNSFKQLYAAINSARLGIEASGLARDQAMLDIASQQLDVHRQMSLLAVDEAQTTYNLAAGFVSAAATLNPFAALGSIPDAAFNFERNKINTEFWEDMAANLQEESAVAGALYQNQVARALAELSGEAPALYGAIDRALSALRGGVANAHTAANALLGNERKAKYALAMATGADFVAANDDASPGAALVPLHVNTVYRRQFAVTQNRYEDALKRAKQAAYIARLAIEQRLGVRLENLYSDVGPVEAPILWAEDLCSLQGVNYDELRTADPTAVGGDTFDAQSFADQYVGDYVNKLEEFVEFYNIENPFKEGTDSAVISVREDVGHGGIQCIAESRNLLSESERLFSEGTEGGSESRLGWRTSPCDDNACLEVVPGDGLQNPDASGDPVTIEGPDGIGSASWLRTVARAGQEMGDGSVPRATVFQTVDLQAGTVYSLSWWDVARDIAGGPYTGTDEPPEYRASVYTKTWAIVETDTFVPSTEGDSWGPRHVMFFTVSETGAHHVAFKAAANDAADASLGIANVQLEVLNDVSNVSAYEPTGHNRAVVTTECKTMGKEGWQQAFRRVCGGDGCYYELQEPLVIDTEALNHGQTSLVGKFAPGNYNYRNGTIALNLVGTGVIDCSDDERMSCYGSGYIEYELDHLASAVKILGNSQDVHCFDFRVGRIRGGKALATERFLTLPMSSADKGLIEQSGFLKGELAGRPLDGVYRLRIKETPALRWENLEDIQLVFNYGYWSAVDVANAL